VADVLQEYLIKLAYRMDQASSGKADKYLSATSKNLLKLGGVATASVAAVAAATTSFAYSMRKLYADSELANSSIKNLKGIEYAGKQIGLESGAMGSAIHGMAQAMRLNPGIKGLVESFGVKVTGRDTADVAMDYVRALQDMPEYQGAQYAAQLGIDADTFHQMSANLDMMAAKKKESDAIWGTSAVGTDQAKKDMQEYTGLLDRIALRFDVLEASMLSRFMPSVKDLAKTLENTMQWWTGWADGINSVSGALDDLSIDNVVGFLGSVFGVETQPAKRSTKKTLAAEKLRKSQEEGDQPATGKAQKIQPGFEASAEFFKSKGWTEEQSAGIAAGLQKESGFDPRAVGDKGSAKGIAQWHPDRQAEFKKWSGKSIDESGLEEQLGFVNYELREGKEKSAGDKLKKTETGAEAGAVVSNYYERPAAKEEEARSRGATAQAYLDAADKGKTHIEASTMQAALPSMQASTMQAALPSMQASTMQANLGTEAKIAPQINQTTNINVTGTGAAETGKTVAKEQGRVNADIVRNMGTALS
jgi:hypothetical protein